MKRARELALLPYVGDESQTTATSGRVARDDRDRER